ISKTIWNIRNCKDWCCCFTEDRSMKVRIFDTTLRDGEQTPGVALAPEQKLNIAKKLDTLGVDVIEAGFPIISEGEHKAIKMITSAHLKGEVCGLVGNNKKKINGGVSEWSNTHYH